MVNKSPLPQCGRRLSEKTSNYFDSVTVTGKHKKVAYDVSEFAAEGGKRSWPPVTKVH